MGCSSSSSPWPVENYKATIRTKDGKTFIISYDALVQHVLLLRKVINHPEMTQEGPLLDYYITNYRKKMAQGKMRTKGQQFKLSWQIEWIWHVHRLHPLAYLNDCNKQLPDGLVNKEGRKFIKRWDQQDKLKTKFSSTDSDILFIPSIDLANAVIRQKDFLEKFRKYFLYSYNLNELKMLQFENLVRNYVLFIKLADKNQTIVPTFDIDLIWHTHMRYPSLYQKFSIASCGFILDHDDSIKSNILTDAYQITADRWKQAYQSEYGQNIDNKHLQTSHFISPPPAVSVPVLVSTVTKRATNSTFQSSYGSSGASVGSTGYAGNKYKRVYDRGNNYEVYTREDCDGDCDAGGGGDSGCGDGGGGGGGGGGWGGGGGGGWGGGGGGGGGDCGGGDGGGGGD